MNISCWSGQGTPGSGHGVGSKEQKIKQLVKDLLLEVGRTPSAGERCLHCGQPMEYVDTTLWFYGDEDTFSLRLPVCHCQDKNPDSFLIH